MSISIIPFKFNDKELRAFLDESNQTWFIGNSVCNHLEYSNPRKAIADHVDKEDRGYVIVQDGVITSPVTERYTGHPDEVLVINESGIYSLMLRSKKDTAKSFARWVTHDVLPSIRKTGSYGIQKSDQISLALVEALDRLVTNIDKLETNHKSLEKRVEKLEKEPKQTKALKSEYGSPKGKLMSIRVYARTHGIAVESSDLPTLGRMAVKESDRRRWPIGQTKEYFPDGMLRQVNTYYQDILKTVFDEWLKKKESDDSQLPLLPE